MKKITEELRDKSEKIILNSSDILTIKKSGISKLAQILKKMQKTGNSNPFFLPGINVEKEISLNTFFDTVNFCFKNPYTHIEYKYVNVNKRVFRRSFGLFKALADSDIDWGDLKEVSKIDKKKWGKITQITDQNALFLGQDRYLRISGFARYLISKKLKATSQVIKMCNYDALELVILLSKSGYFDDPFLKRAQVCTNRVNSILIRRKNIRLKNINDLTCMADYRLPQLFYNLQLIELSPKLKMRLIKEIPIEPDSREETALRASVIAIGEMLSKILKISEAKVDNLLWKLSKKMLDDNFLKIPHMLVATDKY